MKKLSLKSNKIFASGQAIPAASNGVLRSTSHGSLLRTGRKNCSMRTRRKQRGIKPAMD